jgi:diguanylate cyclase (GGDEF)-like protein/PAS domain S-box-containing protein
MSTRGWLATSSPVLAARAQLSRPGGSERRQDEGGRRLAPVPDVVPPLEALVGAAVLETSTDLIIVLDQDRRIRYASPAAGHVLGRAADVLPGSTFDELVHPGDQRKLDGLLQPGEGDRDGAAGAAQLRLLHSRAEWVQTEVIVTDLRADPRVGGLVLTIRDATERKRVEAQLAHHAFHDPLTGLPNRALLLDRLRHALARARRSRASTAVLFCDLDNFKVVSDSLGHQAGDELLVMVATRMKSRVREQDTACHLSGDEFAVLVEGVEERDCAALADRLLEAMRTPFTLYGRQFFLSMSIGLAMDRAGERAPQQLLQEADVALRRAKARGKGRYELFDTRMLSGILERIELETELRRALEGEEIVVYYQPKLATRSGIIVGVEALARWPHPRRGMVPPVEFVAVAEEAGLVSRLGMLVLEQACHQVRNWQQQHGQDLTLAVNVSTRQLHEPGMVETVAASLARSGLAAHSLILEITEGSLSSDEPACLSTLTRLKELGVQLAIDDFGTGYSSLGRLGQFPIDELKIDRSFISEISSPNGPAPLVTAVIALARGLGHRVVAEGVETPEQLAFLRAQGCDQVQGYLFARPAPAGDMATLLATGSRVAPRSSSQRPTRTVAPLVVDFPDRLPRAGTPPTGRDR